MHLQLSKIGHVDDLTLRQIEREIRDDSLPWQRAYVEYQSGGWWTIPLMNPSGNLFDAEIEDGHAQSTSVLARMPWTQSYLESLGLNIMAARLARMDAGAALWEHRDYTELEERPRLRLHIPVITHREACLFVSGQRFHLARGFIWKLDPTTPHAAFNDGFSPRIHLLIDCYVNNKLATMLEAETAAEPFHFINTETKNYREHALRLAKAGFLRATEHLILRQYGTVSHHLESEDGRLYGELSSVFDEAGHRSHARLWEDRKQKFLGIGVTH